jgi:hypothetical protein
MRGLSKEQSSERLEQLKRDIALHQYDVDSAAVADAIVRKLRLVRRGREALASSEAGRSPADRPAYRRAS